MFLGWKSGQLIITHKWVHLNCFWRQMLRIEMLFICQLCDLYARSILQRRNTDPSSDLIWSKHRIWHAASPHTPHTALFSCFDLCLVAGVVWMSRSWRRTRAPALFPKTLPLPISHQTKRLCRMFEWPWLNYTENTNKHTLAIRTAAIWHCFPHHEKKNDEKWFTFDHQIFWLSLINLLIFELYLWKGLKINLFLSFYV